MGYHTKIVAYGQAGEATVTFQREKLKRFPGLFSRLKRHAATGASPIELFKIFNAGSAAYMRRQREIRAFSALLNRRPSIISSINRKPHSTESRGGCKRDEAGDDGGDPDPDQGDPPGPSLTVLSFQTFPFSKKPNIPFLSRTIPPRRWPMAWRWAA